LPIIAGNGSDIEVIMEKREEELVVEGYRFATIADAETARMEVKKIENLERNLDCLLYTSPSPRDS